VGLVAVLPGWFWAVCLCASADRISQLVYGIALSITLVPTAALVQAHLFGTGVTFAITVSSALVVFLAGLLAYLRFGRPKGSEEPIAPKLARPGFLTLIPLIAAFAMALGAMLGLVGGERVPLLIAGLVILAGIAHLFSSRRRDEPQSSLPDETAETWRGSLYVSVARYVLLSVVLALVLLRGYLGPVRHDWPFPRGIDKYEHAVMTGMMLSDGSTESFMLYPPGFHVLAAELSRLSGLEPMELFAVLAPALLALPALGCYVLGSRLWGWPCGVAAAAFCGLLLDGTYQHINEARWPNFIGSQFLMILAVATLIGLYASPTVRPGLLLALLGSSTVLYHQIASYSEAVLLAFVALLFLPYLLWRDRARALALFLSLALLGLLSVLYAWDTYDLGQLAAGLLGREKETGRGGEAVAMAIGTKGAYPLKHLLHTTSRPVLWLGLLGAVLLLVDRRGRASTPSTLAHITLLLWTLLLFVGSRTGLSGFPDRFERDLGVPLALLAALAFITILSRSRLELHRRPVVLVASLLAVLLTGALIGLQTVRNIEGADAPSPRQRDRPPPPAVAAAGRWLREHNSGGSIISTPYLNYVPSRAMLALGGYTRMQSYDPARIKRARDLPPFGAGPLRDALWVVYHPKGERTGRILEVNDVRYVVIYKRYPGMNWHFWKDRTIRYRVAFENEAVLIMEPRGA
ncbi:MAG: hypothetical protein M3324_09710, partial [Actinomycetota bacterium]|nr:hypothetical protein [Actinomycetota bacterium]